MNSNNIQLGVKLVGDIEGEFFIPAYQRGYRWDETQVKALLNDIYENGDNPYCLQPLVVRADGEGRYEVIDGQQRLTTIYIIYKYLKSLLPNVKLKYELIYQTRKENSEFFNDMENEVLAEKNIDFHFIYKSYKTVKEWFSQFGDTERYTAAFRFISCFNPDDKGRNEKRGVKFIWYEQKDATVEDAIALFTRLNIGRIPLTNAELVKALLLCRDGGKDGTRPLSEERQQEIALQWDTIERELHDEDFWYFLTNKQTAQYPTRIELLFDFMASGKVDARDKYATFDWFSNQRGEGLEKLWERTTQYYYRLKEWYKKNDLYHKIGYLIASRYTTINVLMDEAKDLKKSKMDRMLDVKIKDSINFKKAYSDLSYENDYDAITRILLLFNVVSLMKTSGGARFPFKEFNRQGKDKWSLEHIHAQNSLRLNTQDKWKEWLEQHVDSVRGLLDEENKEMIGKLLEDIDSARKNDRLTDVQFIELEARITKLLSEENSTAEYVHSLSNMALLQASANSALSNGLFDAKRREILKMDAGGQYIPYCTKMVFLKYYSSEQQNKVSFHFWGEADRKAYIDKMNEILKDYRKEEIQYDYDRA